MDAFQKLTDMQMSWSKFPLGGYFALAYLHQIDDERRKMAESDFELAHIGQKNIQKL